jgi:hypothetical protein
MVPPSFKKLAARRQQCQSTKRKGGFGQPPEHLFRHSAANRDDDASTFTTRSRRLQTQPWRGLLVHKLTLVVRGDKL